MPVDVGSSATVEWRADAAGDSATLTVTAPDGTTSSPTPDESSGTFTATFAVTLAGRYLLRWENTTDDVVWVDTLEVWPADPRFLISFGDAVQSLQWRDADRARHGDMLRLYIAAATPIIEDITGAILDLTIEQHANGGKTGVALWERPEEVTSVTIDGAAHEAYVVNANAGIVYYDRNGTRFPPGRQIVKITYTTGGAQIAPNIQLATRELVRHLWQIGQQAIEGQPVDYGDRPMGTTPSGFAVPKRVIELCASTYSLPGTA